MYRAMLILIGVLLASPLLAVPSPVGEFYWVEGETDLPVIDLNSIQKAGSSTSWGYAVNCDEQQVDDKDITAQQSSSQGQSSSSQAATPTRFFSCLQEGSSLSIQLRSGKSGTGKIKVTAIPTQEGQNSGNESFYYTVRVIREPTSSIEECVSWSCSLYTEFYMGYEGTSVSQVNEKGNVRFQYSGYSQIDPWRLHVYGDLLQTSVQEQSATQEACTDEAESEDCNLDATIAANIGFFSPLFLDEPDTDLKIGPMLEYNVQKLDSNDVFAKSYYAGVRFAYNKIRFFNIAYGKSEGIPGERVEFTGQLPIYGEKLVTGMVLNVSVDDAAEELGAAPGDSINIYIMTRIDFTKIFTSFAGN